MLGLVKVLRGMPVLGVIAAPDVATGEAKPEMNPVITRGQALLAALRSSGFDLPDL
jgi:hypothetical protein